MKKPILLALAIAGVCWGAWLTVSGKPPASPPILLHYREAPLFLGAHEHPVTALAFSPDGSTLATGDEYLRLWDVADGRLKSMHSDDASRGIHGLAFSPDGQHIAAVGGFFGKDLLVWDKSATGVAQAFEPDELPSASGAGDVAQMIYKGRPIVYKTYSGVAYSPDGQILAAATGAVTLRDTESGKVLATLKQPASGVKALAFTPDGKTLATAAEDKKVRLWSVPGGKLEATLDGPTQPLVALAISPDGSRFAAISSGNRSLFDRSMVSYLWSWERSGGSGRKTDLGGGQARQVAFIAPTTVVVAAGKELLSLDLQEGGSNPPRKIWSHSEDVLSLAVSTDRRLLASGGQDRTVDLIDLATHKLVHRIPGMVDRVSSVAVSHDGKRFATGTLDQRFSNRMGSDGPAFAARAKRFFSGDENASRRQRGEVHVWSSEDGRLQTTLPLPECQVTAIEFIGPSDLLAVAGWSADKGGMLSLWNATGSKHVRDLVSQGPEVLSLAVSPDGRILASGDAGGNLDMWEISSGTKTRSHKHDHPVKAVAFSRDGKLLATADADKTVRVFDSSATAIKRTMKSSSPIESLEFSPDANLLAAGTRHRGLELWDLRTSAAGRTLKAAGDYFETMPGYVAFSPDGRFVVCGGHGKDIAVFDVASATLHRELRGHIHASTAAAFLPDGRLISGGEDRTTRLWNAETGKSLAIWIVVPADPKQHWEREWVGFSPTGSFVASTPLDCLVGWQTGGELIAAREDAKRRRVENLFDGDSAK